MGDAPDTRPELSLPARAWAVVRSAGCWVLLTLFTLVVGALHIPGSLIAPEGRWGRWLEMAYMWAIDRKSVV